MIVAHFCETPHLDAVDRLARFFFLSFFFVFLLYCCLPFGWVIGSIQSCGINCIFCVLRMLFIFWWTLRRNLKALFCGGCMLYIVIGLLWFSLQDDPWIDYVRLSTKHSSPPSPDVSESPVFTNKNKNHQAQAAKYDSSWARFSTFCFCVRAFFVCYMQVSRRQSIPIELGVMRTI